MTLPFDLSLYQAGGQAQRDSIRRIMKSLLIIYLFLLMVSAFYSCAQKTPDHQQQIKSSPLPANTNKIMRAFPGGACEDCNLLFLGMPLELDNTDTSAGWSYAGHRLVITGTIYQQDHITPAPDVLLYYYHADHHGYYTPAEGMYPGARRHGHLRGWIKTGPDGKYAIYTSRPAPYLNGKTPSQIHVFIKEPFIDVPYAIDDWIFDDDPLVTREWRNHLQNRGGSGILKVNNQNDVQIAKHDIILGLNIPGYPE